MQKIVLYNPQAVFYTMPLGLLAVASALDPARYEVQIIDGRLERDPVAAVLKAIDGALCLGVTVLTGAPIRDALRISRAAKAQQPDLPVVWGGWHPSLFPLDTLAEPSVDISVQGQGEATFTAIVERLAAGTSVAGIPGSASRAHGIPQLGPPRLMQAVNTLAPHNYDIIPVERYFGLKHQRQFDYISSAGCHFRCAFCADPFVYKRKWAGLDPARVGEELEQHWRRYQFSEVSFQDETFFHLPRPGGGNCRRIPAARPALRVDGNHARRPGRAAERGRHGAVRARGPAPGDDRCGIGLAGDDGLARQGHQDRTGAGERRQMPAPWHRRDLPVHRRLPWRERRQRCCDAGHDQAAARHEPAVRDTDLLFQTLPRLADHR